jgi:hypothetical protein
LFFNTSFDISIFNNIFISDSPYGDVSGLPDPFHDPNMGLDVQHHPMQHLSFDENLHQHQQQQQHHQQQQQQHQQQVAESGYSTPSNRSRRIIREIIV